MYENTRLDAVECLAMKGGRYNASAGLMVVFCISLPLHLSLKRPPKGGACLDTAPVEASRTPQTLDTLPLTLPLPRPSGICCSGDLAAGDW